MKLLLDTCTFLWLTIGSNELSSNAVDAFADPKNEVYLSAVSAWEINVKYRLGKLSLPLSPDQFIPKERKRHLVTPLDLSEQDTLVSYSNFLVSDQIDRVKTDKIIKNW